MLNREEMKKTQEWQSLNAIWRAMTAQQRETLSPQFRTLSDFIRSAAQVPRDLAAEDAPYQKELSNEALAFAQQREQEGLNVYDGLMKLLRRSSFEGPDKVLFFFQLRYGDKYPWAKENVDELSELIELAWRRSLERGFVPGEGFPRP